MLRPLALLIFLIGCLNQALATTKLNSSEAAWGVDNPFQVAPLALDLNYGKDIELLFGELSKNQLKKKSVDNLKKYQNKLHSFSVLNTTYDRLNNILKINSQDTFYSSCSIVPRVNGSFVESLSTRINISIDKYCRFLFVKRMAELSANMNFSSRDLAYFKEASPFFSTGENQPELVALLKHFKSNATELEKLSNLLIEKYIEFKVKPPTSVLTNLKVNSQFTRFLQSNLDLDDNSTSFFQEELIRLTRDAQEAADRADHILAKSLITNAVTFYNKNKSFIYSHRAWNGIILTGKALFYKGHDNDALDVFALARSIADKEDVSESNFYLIWPHIINRNFQAIRVVIEKNNFEKNFDNYDSKLQYWIAITFLKNGDTKKGLALLNKIIISSPYSFYSIISLKELASQNKSGQVSEADILSKLISKDEPLEYPFDKTSLELKNTLRRYAVWNKLGNDRFATLELRSIQYLSKAETFADPDLVKTISNQAHKEYLIINIIRLLNGQKKYVSSFKIFQDSLDQNSLSLNYKIIKFIFPLNYFDLIKKNSENLDPLIVISLIRQESAFNPEAKSGVGAKGLMQLMPATARRFNHRIKPRHLGNPEVNVAIGTKYLRQLFERFDGNLIFALASYNAGENRIDRWRKEIFRSSDPLSTIESIPYEETRNYVKLIYRNNFFYSLLSNRSVFGTPLEESFKVTLSTNSKR